MVNDGSKTGSPSTLDSVPLLTGGGVDTTKTLGRLG